MHMAARRKSEKGKAKQLEKELPWGQIPPQESHFYVAAARRQPVGRAPDVPVLNTVDPERVLSSRFAYKDQNHNRRKHDSTLPCCPKATLCVAGQHDPDLGRMDNMATVEILPGLRRSTANCCCEHTHTHVCVADWVTLEGCSQGSRVTQVPPTSCCCEHTHTCVYKKQAQMLQGFGRRGAAAGTHMCAEE